MNDALSSPRLEWKSVCQDCGKSFDLREAVHRCLACRGPLQLECDYGELGRIVNQIDWQGSGVRPSKYWEALPLSNLQEIVSLQEGATPLRRLETLGRSAGLDHLWAKLESANPTGVFKDRGTLLEISWAKQQGFQAVVCASTGNMAASVSAYSARAGLPCFIFVPEGVPVGKLSQIMAYGAKVIAVRGTYNDCVRLTEYLTSKHTEYFLAGDYALRAEGQKTTSYEVVEQLHWKSPDWVVVPVGNGTNFSGIAKGFKDLYALGLIPCVPRFVAAQAALTAPIVDAWKHKQTHVTATSEMVNTVAQAANVGVPLDATKVLHTLRSTNGVAVALSEDEILSAQMELSRTESVFVEPSAALSWAAAKKLAEQRIVAASESVVLVLTGHGLKDPKSILAQALEPSVIEPREDALDHMWEEKLYALGKITGSEADRIVWNREGVPENLGERVTELFGVTLDGAHTRLLAQAVERFHEKMEIMRLHSLNLLLEEVAKLPSDYREILRVLDYTITVPLHAAPEASVTVQLNGDTYKATTSGVGPVDAVTKGAEEALAESPHNVPHELVDYDVEIDKGGTDAVVRVHLTLQHPDGTRVTGSVVSPDVITASVRAFERAYNLLYQKVTS